MAISFRPTKQSDYESVHSLLDEAELGGEWFTQALFERMVARNPGLYWLAEHKGCAVGSIFANHDGGYYGYIYKLVVDPSYQHRGIGKQLLQKVLEAFATDGVEWFFGLVRKDNAQSVAFFRRNGFDIGDGHYFANTFQRINHTTE